MHVLDNEEPAFRSLQQEGVCRHRLLEAGDRRQGGNIHTEGAQVGALLAQVSRALDAEAGALVAVAGRLPGADRPVAKAEQEQVGRPDHRGVPGQVLRPDHGAVGQRQVNDHWALEDELVRREGRDRQPVSDDVARRVHMGAGVVGEGEDIDIRAVCLDAVLLCDLDRRDGRRQRGVRAQGIG